jgi:hypothetical protein
MAKSELKTTLKEEVKPMVKRLSIDTLDEKTKAFLKGIKVKSEQYLLELNGKPVLGIVSPEKVAREERFAVFEKVWAKNKEVDEAEVERDVAEAVAYVRKQKSLENQAVL